MKAQSAKLILERIRQSPQREAILNRVDESIVREVELVRNTHWLALRVAWPLNRAVWEELGDDDFRAFQLAHTVAAVETPVFGGLIKGLVNLFGTQPGGMLKHAARGWGAALRNCGTMATEQVDQGHARVVMSDLPELLMCDRSYFVSNEGSLQVVFELTGVPGQVVGDDSERESGTLRYDLRW